MPVEPNDDQVDYRELELNCEFYGGHSFNAEGGTRCIWCTATLNSTDGDNASPTGVNAND